MPNCDRCGAEIKKDDFYQLSYMHFKRDEESHWNLCPRCLNIIKHKLDIENDNNLTIPYENTDIFYGGVKWEQEENQTKK